MNVKTIIRIAKNKENPYAQIARSAVQDETLSWKATGLLTYLLSLPDDWQIYLADLIKRKKDGMGGTRSALKELRKAGYIEKVSTRNDKGHYVKHEHFVHEEPLSTIHKSKSGLLDATNKTSNIADTHRSKIRSQKEYEIDRNSPFSTPAEEDNKRRAEIQGSHA